MTTEQKSLRERVAEAILDNEWEPMGSKEWDELYDREKRRYLEMADEAIAIVREALLSEEAKAALLVHGPHIPSVLGRQMYGKDAEMILNQIADAVFGKEQ